ncbi:helix-turn-helix domain-containing protein [Rhodococcus sp. NPDC019627]|uniref:helix-turn-helix domain-containing protein n=1 Tax=unclassified Rhodococcus (in: high G+C Gram-positive bacteria) TaxID=192944 RepID=UPI003790FD75
MAETLGMTPSGVWRLVARGDLREAFKAPGSRGARMFHRRDVEQLKAKREKRSAAT